MALDHYTFGPHKIRSKEVFYSTHLSFAMVNLRPVLPGTFFFLNFDSSLRDFLNNKACQLICLTKSILFCFSCFFGYCCHCV